MTASRPHAPTLPAALLPLALLGALVVVLPIAGLALRVPWGDFATLVTTEDSLTALRLSLTTASVSALLCLVLGVPLGMMLARSDASWLRVLRAFVLLPVVLPPVVGGLALLATFGRQGLLATPMQATGIDIAFTSAAVVCAQVFVSLPFVVMGVESAMRTHGTGYETAAAVLGAGPTRTFATVTLPLLLPAIAASAVLAFARSLGEFGATLTFAGSLAGTTRTLPLEIYLRRETDPDAAMAVSMLLVVIALIVVLTVYSLPQTGRHHRFRRPTALPTPEAPVPEPPSPPESSAPESSASESSGPLTAHSSLLESAHASPRLVVEIDAPDRGVTRSFAVQPGETLALTGPNGVGKSTVLAVIAGLLIPPRSRVELNGRLLEASPPHRRGVTLLLQDPRLFPHMTAVGNIVFGLRSAGITGAAAKVRAQEMLDDLGVGHCAAVRPQALSGGQQARVALARALATDPQVVLLDEPSAALDQESAPQIRALLADLLQDRTCVLVSHDPQEVGALAHRVIRLDR